jgi:antitoxin PrlF
LEYKMAMAREITATITERGQVTLPAEVRKALGLKARGKVSFRIDAAGEVTVQPAKADWRASFGAVKPISRPEDFDRMSKEYREETADRVVRQMKKS